MTTHVWARKGLVLSVGIVTLAVVAAAVSIALAFPEPVSSAGLGPDWQCSRIAFVITSCSRIVGAQPAFASAQKDPDCPRRTVWRDAAR